MVDEERCNLCGLCLDFGCPALAPGDDAVSILEACIGCGLCVEVCKRGALSLAEPTPEAIVNDVTTVALVGVGGQGILLAAAILAEAASAEGLHVKANEVHGMAQRGGSVVSTVRFGHQRRLAGRRARRRGPRHRAARGPPRPRPAGARRHPGLRRHHAHRARRRAAARGGVSRATWRARPPPAASGSSASTPRGWRAGRQLRAANVALLGAASAVLPFSETSWQRALQAAVPAKILEVNRRAFALGRDQA